MNETAQSNESDSLSSYTIVHSTIRDLFDAQHSALEEVRQKAEKQKLHYVLKSTHDKVCHELEEEKLSHAKTAVLLAKTKDEFQFLKDENEILKEQTLKDKQTFETTLRNKQSKLSRETKRCDFLHSKCSEAERTIEGLSDTIQSKDREIDLLKQRLKNQKDNMKQKLAEIDINKMQQDYMAKTLGDSIKT
uniref:Spermatogenesis-associated protein 24-like n=1 Tax=Phallusia mammillata TaxID=59560 RepID=A0A6F9DST8_9ASCI|nr:spermatogenesis-associated protein 24-like [Phallusia mammillata]